MQKCEPEKQNKKYKSWVYRIIAYLLTHLLFCSFQRIPQMLVRRTAFLVRLLLKCLLHRHLVTSLRYQAIATHLGILDSRLQQLQQHPLGRQPPPSPPLLSLLQPDPKMCWIHFHHPFQRLSVVLQLLHKWEQILTCLLNQVVCLLQILGAHPKDCPNKDTIPIAILL